MYRQHLAAVNETDNRQTREDSWVSGESAPSLQAYNVLPSYCEKIRLQLPQSAANPDL